MGGGGHFPPTQQVLLGGRGTCFVAKPKSDCWGGFSDYLLSGVSNSARPRSTFLHLIFHSSFQFSRRNSLSGVSPASGRGAGCGGPAAGAPRGAVHGGGHDPHPVQRADHQRPGRRGPRWGPTLRAARLRPRLRTRSRSPRFRLVGPGPPAEPPPDRSPAWRPPVAASTPFGQPGPSPSTVDELMALGAFLAETLLLRRVAFLSSRSTFGNASRGLRASQGGRCRVVEGGGAWGVGAGGEWHPHTFPSVCLLAGVYC